MRCRSTTFRMLEVDQEGRDQKRYPDYGKPKQIVGEIRIDAQQHAGKHWNDLGLPLAIDKVPNPERTGDDAYDETIHADRLSWGAPRYAWRSLHKPHARTHCLDTDRPHTETPQDSMSHKAERKARPSARTVVHG